MDTTLPKSQLFIKTLRGRQYYMPTFDCPACGETFSSKKKREEHIDTRHDGNAEQSGSSERIDRRLLGGITDSEKVSAIIFGILMIGLPFGGALFYASLGGGGGGTSNPDSGSSSYSANPPVGYNIQNVPEPDTQPRQPITRQPLSKDTQVFTLLRGGPQNMGQGIRPAVLLQYACTDCPETRGTLENISRAFNQGGSWVYVAPYPDMDTTVAATAFRNSQKMDTANETLIRDFICSSLRNQPTACVY
jgi:hypothetical protein